MQKAEVHLKSGIGPLMPNIAYGAKQRKAYTFVTLNMEAFLH